MAEITAALVKELRDRTGAGMMDCKKALAENGGDIEASIDWLRTKGLAAAAKKAGRVAAEGLVGVATDGTRGAMVEVNSETDFVGKNEQFQEFVRDVTQVALAGSISDIEALGAAAYPGGDTVAEKLTSNIATIGENQSLRRSVIVSVNSGVVTGYVHNAAAPGMGKIGVLVAMNGGNEELGKQIAMHIAAVNPASLSEADLDPAVVEKEKQVQMDIARESGKPEAVQEKMVEGAVAKFAKENALMSQILVHDNKTPIEQVVAQALDVAGMLLNDIRRQVDPGAPALFAHP